MRYLQHSYPKRHPLTRKHERTLHYLLIGTAAFNAADYLLTLLALRMGYRELNPVMDLVVHYFVSAVFKFVLKKPKYTGLSGQALK